MGLRGSACSGNDGKGYQTSLEVTVTYYFFINACILHLYPVVHLLEIDYLKVMLFCVQEFIFQGVLSYSYGSKACVCDGGRSPKA